MPTSDILKPDIPKLLNENKFTYKRIVFYNTIPQDLSDIDINQFDVLVFFSPAGVKSLLHNFPDFKQNKIVIAAFGSTTTNAAKEAGFTIHIQAPTPKVPSMAMALEQYLEKALKSKVTFSVSYYNPETNILHCNRLKRKNAYAIKKV